MQNSPPVHNISSKNVKHLESMLVATDFYHVMESNDPEESFKIFDNLLCKLTQIAFPLKTVARNKIKTKTDWMTSGLLTSSRNLDKL